MTAQDTLKSIRSEERLPTLEEAAAAAEILMLCNGMDLSEWTGDIFPSDEAEEGLKAIVRTAKGQKRN